MDYFYLQEADQFNFIQVPTLLFINPMFKQLSSDAKLMYGLLLSRMNMSRKNGWIDEMGRVYIQYPIEEIQEIMGCGNQKAIKILGELDTQKGVGLIEKRRLGLGKSNVIYVKNFTTAEQEEEVVEEEKQEKKEENKEDSKSHFLKCENHTSANVKTTLQEVGKSHPRYIDNKYIYNKYNNLSIHPNHLINKDSSLLEEMDRWKEIEQILCHDRSDQVKMIREIIHIVLDVIQGKDETQYTINDQSISGRRVKEKFAKLEYEDVALVLKKLEENQSHIVNIRSYIIAMLYNSTSSLYWHQLYCFHENVRE